METGLVHIYSGEGKGKTTASVGLAVRALSHGLKVCYSFFNKKPSRYGNTEVNTLEENGAVIFGNEDQHPSFNKNVTKEQHAKLTLKSFEELKELVYKQDFDMLVMDEILISVRDNFLDEKVLIDFINNKPKNLELVLTGRGVTNKLVDVADYVSNIQMVKHPFQKGIKSRIGIEY